MKLSIFIVVLGFGRGFYSIESEFVGYDGDCSVKGGPSSAVCPELCITIRTLGFSWMWGSMGRRAS